MASRFLSNITIHDAYTFPSADGTNGQVIGTDGAGNLSFIDQTTEALTLNVTVKNVSGGSLAKGTIVHAHPSANPPSGNVVEVVAADYDQTAYMPAIGVLNETLANEAEGQAIMFGAVSGIDTSSFSAGDELWVGNNGAFTNTKPATAGQLIQKIAVVIKSHASNGLIKIFGAGRTNDVPLPLYIDDANQRVGIGVPLPSETLEVDGGILGEVIKTEGSRTNTFYSSNTGAIAEFKPSDTRTGIQPILRYRSTVNGSANYMLANGATTYFGVYDSGVPTDYSDMIAIDPNSSLAPSVRIGDAGSSGAYISVGGNIKLLNNDDSYINGGNLGIGTSLPNEKLEVVGSVKIGNLKIQDANGGRIGFNRNTATGAIYNSSYGAYQLQHNFAGYLELQSYNSAGTFQDHLVFTEDGDLGIGKTPSSGYKLDVAGSIRANSNLVANSVYSSSGTFVFGLSTTLGEYITAVGNDIRFYAGGSVVATIDGDNSRVGIGTTAPSQKLNIYANDANTQPLVRIENDGTGDAALSFVATGIAGWSMGLDNSDLDVFKLSTDAGSLSAATKVTVDRDGNMTVVGDVTANHYFADTHFRSTDTAATLSTTGAGIVYLRPNGYNQTTGQAYLTSGGVFTVTDRVVTGGPGLITSGNGTKFIQLGDGRTDNNYAYIDLIGDTTYTDYGLRIMRNNGGPNTISSIVHRGTGDLQLKTSEAAPIVFYTSGVERFKINGAGGINVSTNMTFGQGDRIIFPDNSSIPDNPTNEQVDYITFGLHGSISQVSGRGALMITSSDDSLILANGEVGRTFVNTNIDADAEGIVLLSDGQVDIYSDLQDGWDGSPTPWYRLRYSGNVLTTYDGTNTYTYWNSNDDAVFSTVTGDSITGDSVTTDLIKKKANGQGTDTYINLDDDAFYPSSPINVLSIASMSSMAFMTDTNSNGTNEHFSFYTQGTTDATATKLFEIQQGGDVNIVSGNLQIGGTTVIDSSRNLTNIGTISSGNITIDKQSAIINMGYQGGPHGINFYDDSAGSNDLRWGFYYRTSPDTITFETGGTDAKFTLDTSGNLDITGISTAKAFRTLGSSNQYSLITRNSLAENFALYVNNGQTGSSSRIARFAYGDTGANTGTEVLNVGGDISYFVNTDVGIGTTSPQGLLHISSGTSGDATLIIESDTDNSNENDNPQLQFKQDAGLTVAKVGLTGDAGTIFTDSLGNAAYLGNDANAPLQLYTNATARLTILNTSGNVGIGTTSPTTGKLVVAGDDNAYAVRIDGSTTTGESYGARFRAGTNTVDYALRVENTSGANYLSVRGDGRVDVEDNLIVDGRLGIGADVLSSSKVRIYETDNDPDTSSNLLYLRGSYSGTKADATDIAKRGLYIDMDSSAVGTNTDEHMLYGINVDVRNSALADQVTGIYSYVESNISTESVAYLRGGWFAAATDSSNSASSISQIRGSENYVSIQDAGSFNSAYGTYSLVDINPNRTTDVGATYGGYFEVQIGSGNAISYGTMFGVRSIVDNNAGTTPSIGSSYLFYGDYQGTRAASNSWGVYVQGDKHYLEGQLGVGTTDPGTHGLSVSGTGNFTGPVTITNDSPVLNLYSSTNGNGVSILFSDHASGSYAQQGNITYVHNDTSSYGSDNAFILESNQTNLTVLADGKLMYKDGLYIKPSSGTGGGTLVIDSNKNITGNEITGALLRLTNTTDASVSSTGHAFQVGPDSGNNIIMDGNEIMARDNGAVSSLNLNPDGGAITIHNNTSAGSFTIGGNTIWHAGNDGSGSGLDADRVDGFDSTALYRKVYDDSFGDTPDTRWYVITLPYFSTSGWSYYYYFDVFAFRDKGNLASQLHYRVYLHHRGVAAGNAQLDADVITILEQPDESLNFAFKSGVTTDSKFYIEVPEDYSAISLGALPSPGSTSLVNSMVSSTDTEPTGFTDITPVKQGADLTLDDVTSIGSVTSNNLSTGRITITDNNVPLIFNESGHTGDGEWWRQVLDAGNIRWDVSTSGGGSFTTHDTILSLNASSGRVDIKTGALAMNGSTVIGNNRQISALGASFTNPVTIYDVTATENPRLSLGRQAVESLNFDVDDVNAVMYFRQDTDSNNAHIQYYTIDSDSTGDKKFIWQRRAADGTSAVTKLILDEDGLDVRDGGSLLMNNVAVIDTSRNLSAVQGDFSSNVNITKNNVGIGTSYGSFKIEDTDAQIDIVSSSDAVWGSAINFVEGASTTANTDVWSIARQTTGGTGDSSLNFNFGTTNAHNNTTIVKFADDWSYFNGKVAIGQTSEPTYQLSVNGNSKFADTVEISKNGIGLDVYNTASSGADTGIRVRGARNGQTYATDNLTAYMLFSNHDDNTTPNDYDLAKIGAGMYDAGDDTGYFQIMTNNGTALTKALDIDKNQDATFYSNIKMGKSGDPKIYAGTGVGLNIDGEQLYLNRYTDSNVSMVTGGGGVIINGTSLSFSSAKLEVHGILNLPYSSTNSYYIRQGNSVGYGYITPFANTGKFTFDNNYTNGGGYSFQYNGSEIAKISSEGDLTTRQTDAKYYNSISGTATAGGWYKIANVNDTSNSTFHVFTYAHSSITFVASRGYAASNQSHINVLDHVYGANGAFANVAGVRIRQNGDVELKLNWSSGPTVQVQVAVFGSRKPSLEGSLALSSSTSTVLDTVEVSGSYGMMRTAGNSLIGGSVGIGVSSPDHKLHIGSAYDDTIVLDDARSSSNTATRYTSSIVWDAYYDQAARIALEHNDFNVGYRKLKLQISGTTPGTYNNGIVLQQNGNVGINTEYPLATFDVNGPIRSNGGTYASGIDTQTNVGFVIQEDHYIYTEDGSNDYLRPLIGKIGDYINIGSSGTSLTDGIKFFSGTTCNYRWHNDGSVAMVLDTTGLGVGVTSVESGYKMQVGGTIKANGLHGSTSVYGTTYTARYQQYFGALQISLESSTGSASTIQLGNSGSTTHNNNVIITNGNLTVNGDGSFTGDVVAYSSSDKRLKDNVKPIENALDKVIAIGGYEFDWNDNQDTYEGRDVGVIAQEVEEVLPEVVETRKDGYKAVKYEKMVPLLIEAIKDQQKQIQELKALLNGSTK
jgi:hypothetical protein